VGDRASDRPFAAASYLSTPDSSQALVKQDPVYGPSLPSKSRVPAAYTQSDEPDAEKYDTIYDILQKENLYDILGITQQNAGDASALRRAYLSRSRKCHPE
jgi:hypothetical protein